MTHSLPLFRRLVAGVLAAAVVAACTGEVEPSAPPSHVPATCGGIEVAIDPSLPCERIAEIALDALRARAPQQVARGVLAINVALAQCPRGEVPPQVTCGNSQFAQLVTVTFGPPGNSGFVEPSLTVAVEPVTGAILGIANPLIR
jgi:hypothetical protein